MFFKTFLNKKLSFSNINFLIYIIDNFINVCHIFIILHYFMEFLVAKLSKRNQNFSPTVSLNRAYHREGVW